MSSQRGILGMKKDPKRQMLFSFRVRDGEEWPSSDSEDSDYLPDGDEKTDSLLEPGDSSSADSEDKSGQTSEHKHKERQKRKLNAKTNVSLDRLSELGTKNHRPKESSAGSVSKIRNPATSKESSAGSASKRRKPAPSERRLSETAVLAARDVIDISKNCVLSRTKLIPALPLEVWGKIFECFVRQFGPLPFLCSAAEVCKSWYNLATSTSLWHTVDLSFGWIKSKDETLKWLAQNRLSHCREINLSGWKNVTNEALKKLSDHCPLLEAINLSLCSKLTSATVSELVGSHPKLRELDLSFMAADAVSTQSLKLVAEKLGPSLTSLVLSGNNLKGFNIVLNAVMDNCLHLETLDLSNCRFSTDFFILNVEKLQASCPNIRVLRLTNCKIRANSATEAARARSPGFIKLQQLSCAMPVADSPTMGAGVPDDLLARLLHNAEHLQLLDLRGCTNFRLATLEAAAATSVEYLYLSQNAVGRDSECLEAVVSKWCHSLKTLDLAWTQPSNSELECVMRALANRPSCPLTQLDLTGISAATPAVVRIALSLPNLQSLDLTSCRSLPRGVKCLHEGRKALSKLRKRVELDVSSSDTDSY